MVQKSRVHKGISLWLVGALAVLAGVSVGGCAAGPVNGTGTCDTATTAASPQVHAEAQVNAQVRMAVNCESLCNQDCFFRCAGTRGDYAAPARTDDWAQRQCESRCRTAEWSCNVRCERENPSAPRRYTRN